MVNRERESSLTTSYQTPNTIFIVGPTASGKSDLAMKVAKKFNGEIICADSQTVRKGLDIGTAKPNKQEIKEIQHHLIDIIEPFEKFSAAEFQKLAKTSLKNIKNRQKLPVVVGGTGLYIDSLLYNFNFRKSVSRYSRQELDSKTVEQLQEIITESGLELPKNQRNPRHLIRVIEAQGESSKKSSKMPGSIIVGIDPGKEVLKSRIERRIQKMLKSGFLDEVESIIEKYGMPPKEFDAIGYKIALKHRTAEDDFYIEAIEEEFIKSDMQYARRQRSWFRRNKDIVWFEQAEEAFEYIKNHLS